MAPGANSYSRYWLWLLFLPVAILYMASLNGINGSNDGSHYALVRSIADDGALSIDRHTEMTEGVDVSAYRGRYYSDRPPGTAVLGVPFYLLGKILPPAKHPLHSKWDAGNPALYYLLLAPVAAALLAGLFFFRIQRTLSVRPAFAALGTAAFLLATPTWKYGALFFSHALSACLVMAAHWLALRTQTDRRDGLLILLGLVLGTCGATEYQNFLLLLIFVAYLAFAGRLRSARAAGYLAGGAAPPVVALAAYHWSCFGSPWATSYTHRVKAPWSRGVSTTFSGNPLNGLAGLLFSNARNTGWFVRMPIVSFGVLGYALFLRDRRFRLLLPLIVLLALVLLFSTHRTYHTFTGDSRYLTPYIGLALLPSTLPLEWGLARGAWPGALMVAGYAVLGVVSLLNTVRLISHSFSYPLFGKDAGSPWSPKEHLASLTGSMPNRRNLGHSLMLYVAAFAISQLVQRVAAALRKRSEEEG